MKRSFYIAVILPVLALASVWLVGSTLINPINHAVMRPAGFDAQDVSIPGVGHTIAAWWVDAGAGSPAVLLVHGARADRTDMIARARLVRRYGFSVLLIDLQGHGETPGEAITFGYREARDVTAALAWLKSSTGLPRKIGIIGCSLGGAATLLASQPTGADALVLESVYPRLTRAVENRLRMRVGALAPALVPLLLWQLPLRFHLTTSDLEPIRRVASVGAPVLFIAGTKDEHTTLEESRELYAAAAQPKSLWILEGARHQDFLAYDPKGYEIRVIPFLQIQLQPAISRPGP